MPATVLVDRYELRTRIGSGATATVWGGFDRRLGREVAVKVLSDTLAVDERFRHRFEREAHHIASLAHPNIVVVHDFGVDLDRPFIVMELVKGKALRQVLAESSALTPVAVANLAVDVLAGLGHAHEAGILHRDIKPGNILVTDPGLSKLADFGIAKATEETVDLTDTGAIVGTVSYASPEQLSGSSLGPPSDLYSLGCVLYECLAGRPPFVVDNIAALVSQQQFAIPQSLRDVSAEAPAELADAIMRALKKDPSKRFASALEMKQAFDAILTSAVHRSSSVSVKKGHSGARTATVTVLFCDVVGSTALQSAIGDDAADEIRHKLFGVLSSLVAKSEGETVKTIGDGIMAVFPESAVDGLRCAVEMTQAASHVADGLAVRVGLSHGEVKSEQDDWFGTPVVEAARLEAAAEPGTVLAAHVVRTIVGSRGGFVFDELPPFDLKGLPGPVRAFRVGEAHREPFQAEKLDPEADVRPVPDSSERSARPRFWRHHRLRVGLGTASAVVVLAAGLTTVALNGSSRPKLSSFSATGTDFGYTPKYEPVRCPSDTGGGPGVICGDLIVPQDRAHPKGRQVRLLVTRAPAETSQPAPDPVFDVGATGVGALSSTARLYSNYIGLSLRGFQGSVPELTCPQEEAASEAALALPPLSPQGLTEQVTALAACRASLVAAGIDPNDYGADAMAADVRDLLRVLHVKQANLIASGADSLVAFDVMRQYPQIVRSVTLEDPVPSGLDSDFSRVAILSAALQRYAALCTADQPCDAAFPDIPSQYERAYDDLQQHPIMEHVSVQSGGAPVPVLVDGQTFAQALQGALSNAMGLPVLASQLYAPDPVLIANVAADGIPQGAAQGVNYSLLCKDELPGTSSYALLEDQANVLALPQFAGVDLYAQLDPRWCQAWDVQPDNQADFGPVVSDIPTFLFGGALDDLSSSAWITQIAQNLTHAVTVVFPTLTFQGVESESDPSCLTTLELEFFDNPKAHFDVSKCEAQSPPIAFAGT